MIPETIRLSLFPLRHVEPMTSQVADLIGDVIEANPTHEEVALYKNNNDEFQYVFVAINSIFDKIEDGTSHLIPYSISLIPASKRGNVEHSNIDFVMAMTNSDFMKGGVAYLGLDPFVGQWGLWSQVALIAEIGAKSAFTDEMGLVYDYFFLRKGVDRQDIIQPAIDMPPERLRKYLRHRSKLLYTPFETLRARPVWGLENGLELFVFQELKRRGMPSPVPQALAFADGSWFPSLYNSWHTFANDNEFVSSIDFYFPEQRLAVFCDGGTHRRAKIRERDESIDRKLADTGIKSVRLPSRDILTDIERAVANILGSL